LAKFSRELLGRKAQECCKRDDGDEVEDEDDGWVPVQCAGDDAERYKDEEDVDIVACECRIDEMQDMLGDSLDARLVLVVLSAADERGVLIMEPAVGGLRHLSLLVVVITACSTVTVKRLLDVFCQAHRLAIYP